MHEHSASSANDSHPKADTGVWGLLCMNKRRRTSAAENVEETKQKSTRITHLHVAENERAFPADLILILVQNQLAGVNDSPELVPDLKAGSDLRHRSHAGRRQAQRRKARRGSVRGAQNSTNDVCIHCESVLGVCAGKKELRGFSTLIHPCIVGSPRDSSSRSRCDEWRGWGEGKCASASREQISLLKAHAVDLNARRPNGMQLCRGLSWAEGTMMRVLPALCSCVASSRHHTSFVVPCIAARGSVWVACKWSE